MTGLRAAVAHGQTAQQKFVARARIVLLSGRGFGTNSIQCEARVSKPTVLSYFAKPYHSWERGLNEHTNGLFRQYFPKGSDLSILSDADVQRVEDKLNSRPRKILGYQTPREIFFSARNLPVALHC